MQNLKRAYEAKYPETKAGVAGGKAIKSTNEIISFVGDTAEKVGLSPATIGIIPFVKDTAEKTGLSDSLITKSIAMWEGLSPATIVTVTDTKLANHQGWSGLYVCRKEVC